MECNRSNINGMRKKISYNNNNRKNNNIIQIMIRKTVMRPATGTIRASHHGSKH